MARVLGPHGVHEDEWQRADPSAPVPERGAVLLSRAQLERVDADRDGALGLRLEPSDEPDDVAALLGRVSLVELVMPAFRDGRAFTQARSLREHHRFAGEIRVAGHVLPDQLRFLARCGVDSVVLPDAVDAASFAAAASPVSIVYQPGIGDAAPIDRLRARRVPETRATES